MKLKNLMLIAISVAMPMIVNAQDYIEEETDPHWLVTGGVGFNRDGYEVEFSGSWWPVKSFGLKMAIGIAGEFEAMDDWDWLHGEDYGYNTNDYASRFKFMPSVELRSPALINLREYNGGIYVYANPGVCLAPGAPGSHEPKWFTWQLRAGVECDLNNVVLQAGYGYSNFNLYSGGAYSYHGYDDPHRHTHTVLVTVGYRF